MIDFTLHPKDDKDRAYQEGQHAREVENLSILDNPYPETGGTGKLSEAWAEGYYDAEAEIEASS